MNTLTYDYENQIQGEYPESVDAADLYELMAIYFIGSCTLVVLVISTWSAVLLSIGAVETGGPIGLIMNVFVSVGLL